VLLVFLFWLAIINGEFSSREIAILRKPANEKEFQMLLRTMYDFLKHVKL
jgi:hypothetical protein